MDKNQNIISELLELINNYPSPHNGQPFRIKLQSKGQLTIFFDKSRGLQSSKISFIFSFVSVGVFMEHLACCCQALGHKLQIKLELPKEAEMHGEGLVKVADCHIEWKAMQRNEDLLAALRTRQTSRKKYQEGIDHFTAKQITEIAKQEGMSLVQLPDNKAAQAIWLNQRAVFDDMFNEPVRQELDHWLRYNQQQKQTKADGLAYDCMELNGRLMKFIVNHPAVLKTPGISAVLKRYYLRTMADSSHLFYMLAPFKTEAQAYAVGEVIMKIWLAITKQSYYLHPFGTIMSNRAAHKDFIKLADVTHETREEAYLVFIFRAGKSKPPAPSMRIPYQKHLLMEQK